MAAVFTLALLGGLLGLGLAIASEVLAVEQDPRIMGVKERLPNLDCGACGYPSCEAFAEAIVTGEVKKVTLCKPGKNSNYNAIIQYLKEHPDEDGTIITLEK